jgi:hypothetical protein
MFRWLRRSRRLQVVLLCITVAVGLAWWYQGRLIGVAAGWYLQHLAAAEETTGDVTRRRQVVTRVHRALLLAPPPEPLVPELYDYLSVLSQRVATGEVSWSWSAYLYTGYARDAEVQRPLGIPRHTIADLQRDVDHAVAFFSIRKRPDQSGVGLSDLLGMSDAYSVEEIEAAHRAGHDLAQLRPRERE